MGDRAIQLDPSRECRSRGKLQAGELGVGYLADEGYPLVVDAAFGLASAIAYPLPKNVGRFVARGA